MASLLAAAAVIAACAAAAPAGPAMPAVIAGPAAVIDGDTIAIGGARLRFLSTDAPELRQPCSRAGALARCGEEAREALARLVDGQAVTCQAHRRDLYRRALVTCAAGGIDVEAALLAAGVTFLYPGVPAWRRAEVAPLQAAAQAQGLGIWAPDVVIATPWSWRKAQKRERAPR